MNQAFHLHRLQQIDHQIDLAEAGNAEIEKILSGDISIKTAQAQVEQAEQELHQAQRVLKSAEFAVKEQQMKIAHSEGSLYSGNLHNPKELQDVQKEIASLKKYLGTLEDLQLEAMMHQEECEAQDLAAREALQKAQATFLEKSAGLLGKKDQNLKTLDRLQAERSAALSLVDQESLKIYDNLRKRKSGVAVTSVSDGSCSACGTNIRPSEVQNARAAQVLVFCVSCGRILYTG